MISKLPGEKWKQISFDGYETLQKKYAVSNQGRLASYTSDMAKDGLILKGSDIEGYKILRLRVNGRYVALLFHRLVGEHFVKRKSADEKFIIHLNHKKQDNRAENIQWADSAKVATHNKQSPAVKAYRKRVKLAEPSIKKGLKLTVSQVKQIKKSLGNPKRTASHKQIAEKYGVSEMTITRIKRGENWSYIKP